jgi:hypothetical protein
VHVSAYALYATQLAILLSQVPALFKVKVVKHFKQVAGYFV